MARHKPKKLISLKTALSMTAVLVVVILIGQVTQNAQSGFGSVLMLILLVAVTAAITYPAVQFFKRAGSQKTLLQKVRVTTNQQLEPLLRRRAQLVRLDPYGKPQREKWSKEIDYFIEQHIQPLLTPGENVALLRNYSEASEIIRKRIEVATRDQPAFQTFTENMTPTEFETFCAEQLRLVGWNARVTMQSRDQGVDVVAEKNGRIVVLQCKLYGRPVGNKSVQEAAAGRAHEQAHFGIVVSNNRYTEAAEQLATTNGILLLHYRDLQNLDKLLDGNKLQID